MREQKNAPDRKTAFNVLHALATAHATSVTVFTRLGFGSEALGFRGLAAVILLWATAAFSRNPLMAGWLLAFFAALVVQRLVTLWQYLRGVLVHSHYAGRPLLEWLGLGEASARAAEGALCFFAGIALACVAEAYRLPHLLGPAVYLGLGFFSLGFDYLVGEAVLHRRARAAIDAMIEQEAVARKVRSMLGDR